MKPFFLSLCLLFTGPLVATSVGLIPMKSFRELETLPPQLEVTFQLACHQKFIRLLRHEIVSEKTGAINIYIGALVEESPVVCQSPAQDLIFRAGTTYSGLYYQVLPMISLE
jgi:hypothetical protein